MTVLTIPHASEARANAVQVLADKITKASKAGLTKTVIASEECSTFLAVQLEKAGYYVERKHYTGKRGASFNWIIRW